MEAKQLLSAPGSDDPALAEKLTKTAASLEEHQSNAQRGYGPTWLANIITDLQRKYGN